VDFSQTQSCSQGPENEMTSLQSSSGFSIYGGKDVQPPSTAVITASLGSDRSGSILHLQDMETFVMAGRLDTK
jgi:hypothetical protein